jgi:arylsulfatase A
MGDNCGTIAIGAGRMLAVFQRSRSRRILLILFMLLVPVQVAHAKANPDDAMDPRPNVIRIMADDLGYGDLGSYGQTLIRTPNLDRLAAEGIRFTQYYAGSSVCNPSRFAFFTGKHSGRTGVITNTDNKLPADIMTVGKLMQSGGYFTGLIGKWALGAAGTSGEPLKQGFDYFFGYPTQLSAHNYYPQTLTENLGSALLEGNKDSDHPSVAAVRQTYAPQVMQEKTLAFIRDNSKRRFYLQLDLNLPHTNSVLQQLHGNGFEHPGAGRYAAKADWTERDRGYAEMVGLMDDYVGEIIQLLYSLGIAQNTLIIFTSDNGPAGERGLESLQRFAATGFLRGKKGTLYEGGIRVPMIAWWPDIIRAGTTSDSTVAAWDEMPTLAELTGSKLELESDGVSFLPLLSGSTEQREDRLLYWHLKTQIAARYADWKWLRLYSDTFMQRDYLYNVRVDPGEKKDLAKLHPEQLQKIQDMAENFK